MFEINGIPYSLEQITAAAEQMGITIEEYKEKFNAVEVDINVEDKIEEEGKPQVTVEEETADAVTEEKVTESQSVPGLLGSPRLSLDQPEQIEEEVVVEEEEVDPERPTLEEYNAKNENAWNELMEIRPDLEVPAEAPKQGEQGFQGEISEKANIYDKGFSKGELEAFEKNRKENELFANYEFVGKSALSRARTVTNAISQLAGSEENMKYLYGVITEDEKIRAEASREIDKRNRLMGKNVLGFGDIKKQKNIYDKIDTATAAAFDAVSSFTVSRIQQGIGMAVGGAIGGAIGGPGGAVAGAGFGGAAILAPIMIGDAIKSYNDSKADEKGISAEQLWRKGEGETFLPGTAGFFMYKLEKAGLKGMTAAFNKQASKIGVNLSNRFLRGVWQMGGAGRVEGLTELAQGAGQEYINQIARDKTNKQAALQTLSWMNSPAGRETLYKGAFGGGFSRAGSRGYNNLMTRINDNRSDLDKTTIKENRRKINELEDRKFKADITDDQIKAINAAQAVYEEEIASAVKNPYAKLKNTTIQERNNVFSINESVIELQKDIIKTEQADNLSDEQKANIIEGLEVRITSLKQEANSIIETADGRTNEEYQKALDAAKDADKEQSKKTGIETTKAQDKVRREINDNKMKILLYYLWHLIKKLLIKKMHLLVLLIL